MRRANGSAKQTLLTISTMAGVSALCLAAIASAQRRVTERETERFRDWWHEVCDDYVIVTNLERDERVCADRNTYHRYGGPPGSAGYWNPAAEELVLYMRGEKAFARAVLNHEAFHQYLHYAAARRRPHIWFNEGFADYFGGAEYSAGRVRIEPFRWGIDTIKKHIRAETHVPLDDFFGYSKARYYRDSDRCYAQGWSVVYFLKEGVDDEHPWCDILPRYYDALLDTGSARRAHETAWKRFTVDGTIARG